jgi:hypothetical protein
MRDRQRAGIAVGLAAAFSISTSQVRLGRTRRASAVPTRAGPLRSQGVTDEQQPILDHAEQGEAFIGVVVPSTSPFDCERAAERRAGHFERNAIVALIGSCLDVVPCECAVLRR